MRPGRRSLFPKTTSSKNSWMFAARSGSAMIPGQAIHQVVKDHERRETDAG